MWTTEGYQQKIKKGAASYYFLKNLRDNRSEISIWLSSLMITSKVVYKGNHTQKIKLHQWGKINFITCLLSYNNKYFFYSLFSINILNNIIFIWHKGGWKYKVPTWYQILINMCFYHYNPKPIAVIIVWIYKLNTWKYILETYQWNKITIDNIL